LNNPRSLSEKFRLAETTGTSYGNGLSSKSPAFYGNNTNTGFISDSDKQFLQRVSLSELTILV